MKLKELVNVCCYQTVTLLTEGNRPSDMGYFGDMRTDKIPQSLLKYNIIRMYVKDNKIIVVIHI